MHVCVCVEINVGMLDNLLDTGTNYFVLFSYIQANSASSFCYSRREDGHST